MVILLKWYLEEETRELRESFEKEILTWPQVDYKKMFGCPCYLANGKMFAGLVTKGLIITKLNEFEKKELKKIKNIQPFIAGPKIIKSWVQINLEPVELKEIMPFIKKSYKRALSFRD